jgi:thymidylate kinase
MAVIIEFIGLSGSGKTTLSRKVIQYLKDRGLNAVGRDRTLLYEYFRKNPPAYGGIHWKILKWLFLGMPFFSGKHLVDTFYLSSLVDLVCRFGARNPVLTEMVFSDIAHIISSEEAKASTLKMAFEAFSLYQIIHELYGSRDDNSVIVLEEGLYKIGQLIYCQGDVQHSEKIALFTNHVRPPDLVIHVDAEPSVCVRRLDERPSPKRDTTGYAYFARRRIQSSLQARVQKLENYQSCTKIILEGLKSKNVPLYEISNNAELDSPTRLLKEYLDGFFKLGQSE